MANFRAIETLGLTLLAALSDRCPDDLLEDGRPGFELLSTGRMAEQAPVVAPAVSLLAQRISWNEHFRGRARIDGGSAAPTPVTLDVHWLMTVWADRPGDETRLLAWATWQLFRLPAIDHTLLLGGDPADPGLRAELGAWQADDRIQIVPEDLPAEDVLRFWDAVTPSFRLTVPFLARGVRIEPQPTPPARPVVQRVVPYLGAEMPEATP